MLRVGGCEGAEFGVGVQDRQKGVDHSRIELLARTTPQLAHGFAVGAARTVRAVRTDGVVGIGGSDDPGAQRDVVAP